MKLYTNACLVVILFCSLFVEFLALSATVSKKYNVAEVAKMVSITESFLSSFLN